MSHAGTAPSAMEPAPMKSRNSLLFSITVVLTLCAACSWWLHQEQRQYSLDRQLIDALEHNDTKTALSLVNAGANPNTNLVFSPSPTLKLLFEHLRHQKGSPENNSPTAFMLACGTFPVKMPNVLGHVISVKEDLPLLQAMLAHGANVNAKGFDNETALHEAVACHRKDTVELLLKQGANVNAHTVDGNTPLIYACIFYRKDEVETVRLLLSFHADVNYVNRHMGSCGLGFARLTGDPHLIRLLKQSGAKENLPGVFGG